LAPGKPVHSFALEAPKPKRKKAEQQTDPNVNVLRDWHRSEHARIRGAEPVYTSNQHAAAGKSWKELLSIRSVDEAKAIITAALTEGFNVDPWAILKAQNKLATGASPRGGRNYQPQAGSPELLALGRGKTRAADLLPDQLARIREQEAIEARELEEALS
jgi:hypothetical protein